MLINDSNKISELSDVWSLTMVIAEILSGDIPYDSPAVRAMTVENFVKSLSENSRPALPSSTPDWLRYLV